MARSGFVLLALLTACSGVAVDTITTSADPPAPTSTADPSTTTTALATTTTIGRTTTTVPPPEEAWSGAAAEQWVTDYLAALAAGAFEQAAWSAQNNGILLTGQDEDELPFEYLQRSCANDACVGPYGLEALGPGLIDPSSMQASSKVLVTHQDTGDQSTIRLATFEGQLVVTGLPPLVSSEPLPTLVEQLFGTQPPEHLVVGRLYAFEIWTGGEVEWTTNWWAQDTEEIEGDWAAVWHRTGPQLVAVSDPQVIVETECPNLMSRDGATTVLERCWSDEWRLLDPATGAELRSPVEPRELPDGEYISFNERASTVVVGRGDAEGNLTEAATLAGVDVLGEGYAGYDALSIDGAHYAYVDHGDPAAFSHFWSPVVVVVDTATGTEVGRWVLDEAIGCLEFAIDWLVACEVLSHPLESDQVALTAINIASGEVRRVETPSRVFLPIPPG